MRSIVGCTPLLFLTGCCCLCPSSSVTPTDPGDPTPPVLTIEEGGWMLVFSPNGNRLAAGETGGNAAIKVWDASTGERLLNVTAHTQTIAGLEFTPDGQQLVSTSYDGTIKLWKADTGELNRTIETAINPRSLAISPQGDRIACGGHDTIKVWALSTADELFNLKNQDHAGSITCLSFSPEGDRIASGHSSAGGRKAGVAMWNLSSGEIETVYTHDEDIEGISCVTFSRDGRLMASGCHRRVKIWSVQTGEELITLGKKGEMGLIFSVDFSPDGKQIACASGFGVHVWDVSTGRR